MARDMTSFYATLSEKDLRRLESEKILRGMKIANDQGWWAKQERGILRQQIIWIRAELRARAEQMKLPI